MPYKVLLLDNLDKILDREPLLSRKLVILIQHA